ncbi:MAG: ABC transporter substrate-binding protein [Candidatus Rokuibacteriota bacterium]|nr:MAG: ABC transporter substrate-binding protein [Candidatus Rokubacteria bacterium]
MCLWRSMAALVLAVALPAAAFAAPAGQVVIAQGVDPTSLDMMNQQETPASNVGAQMFEALLERDQSLKLVPVLAAEMPKLVAPTTWEFKLRRGVKFHNGEDFNADAVKFSIERLANPANKLRGSSSFAPIDRVEVVDPYTVKIHTKKPWPTFLAHIALRQASIIPSKEYAGKDTAAVSRNPIGTGPYKFVRWAKDEEVVMEAFPGYWGGAAKIKTVVFKPIPDDAVRVAALQNSEIDVAVNIPPHLANIIEKHPKVYLSTAPSIRTIQLMIYTHQMDAQHKPIGPYNGPTVDKRVRQAIAYAVDADEIVKGVMDGKAVRVPTMLTSLHFGYDPSLKPIKQDLAKTKKLLADAGFPNGVDIVLNGPQGRYVRDKEVAEAVTGQLTKAGIRTTLRTHEFVNYLNSMVYVHKAGPVWLIGWGHPTMDAEAIYVPLFKSPNIFVNWHNEDFNGMVEEAQTTMDEKKRLALYHRINKLWIEETPAVPLYQQIDLYGASKRLSWKARSDELIRAYDMALRDGK